MIKVAKMFLRRSYPGIILLALFAVIWAAEPGRASGAYTDAAGPGVLVELARPGIAFSGAAADAGAAFREEDAGFSAYYRVPPPPRLDIDAITMELTRQLDQRDPVDLTAAG